MARTKDPAVRTRLVERAGHMLRTREPITLRSLVAGTGVSTMAVYTHFGGMDGVWRALRQEGFTRLGAALERLPTTDDAIRDMAAVAAAYVANALDHPDLFRVMFDATFEFEDAAAAEQTFLPLALAAERARDAGRVAADTDPHALATQAWTVAHGIGSLVSTQSLARSCLSHGPVVLTALLVDAGDEPARCRASVARGWDGLLPDAGPDPAPPGGPPDPPVPSV